MHPPTGESAPGRMANLRIRADAGGETVNLESWVLGPARSPQAATDDEQATDEVRQPKSLAEEECPKHGAVEGEGVVEDHGATGPQPADSGIPSKEADDGRHKSDVEDGGDQREAGLGRQAQHLPHSRDY